MKAGVRALGIAESFRGDRSTLAGAVVRVDRVLDGLGFVSCTVGGLDATDAICTLFEDVARDDVPYVLIGAVAPAWYNILDLSRIHDLAERPVIAVTFEASDGLESGLRDAFSGEALERRLAAYRALPRRRAVSLGPETGSGAETVYVRALGCDFKDARATVRAFTPTGGRPEPIRVARIAARAGDDFLARGLGEH